MDIYEYYLRELFASPSNSLEFHGPKELMDGTHDVVYIKLDLPSSNMLRMNGVGSEYIILATTIFGCCKSKDFMVHSYELNLKEFDLFIQSYVVDQGFTRVNAKGRV